MARGDFHKRLARIRRKNDAPEFGFGATTNTGNRRILNKDGSANIIRLGETKFNAINVYHSLITMPWRKFNLMVMAIYIVANLFFALLYYLFCPNQLNGMMYHSEVQKFFEIFFFSAQSLTTVGYGRLNPVGMTASSIAAVESLVGLLGFALATGLLYGRFSRPTAKLLYSKNALIAPYSHPVHSLKAPTAFMFRIANARQNQLLEVEVQILFSYEEETNGKIARRFQRLVLETEKINFLAMSWTIVHPINDDSPLFGLTLSDLESVNAEFMVAIKAIDDTYAQQIYARTSFRWEDLINGAQFISITTESDERGIILDLNKLSTYKLVEVA